MKKTKTKAIIFLGYLTFSFFAIHAEAKYYFNPQFLGPNSVSDVDLARFNQGINAVSGTYLLDIYVEDKKLATETLELKVHAINKVKSDGDLQPCFSIQQLQQLPIDTQALAKITSIKNLSPDQCYFLDEIIPQANTVYQLAKQRVDIFIPQLYLLKVDKDSIPIQQWDYGINAFYINYDFSGQSLWQKEGSSRSEREDEYYWNFQNGFNINGWRIRNYSILNVNDGRLDYQNLSSYVERAIPQWGGEFRVGDLYSTSDIFDSVSYRGIDYHNDLGMLPSKMLYYAPIVRGIAKTNATIYIYQNDNLIYKKFVSSGPFEITDLSSMMGNGDLKVVVKGVDGQIDQFMVPYASIPDLMREGVYRYSINSGRIRNAKGKYDDNFFQVTYQQGLVSGITVLGGIQLANDYHAVSAGVAKSLGRFGALSSRLINEGHNAPKNSSANNAQLQLSYVVTLPWDNAELSLSEQHYFSKTYQSLGDFKAGYVANEFDDQNLHDQLSFSLSQGLGNWGSFYLSGFWSRYWNSRDEQKSFNLGYSNNINVLSYGINYSHNSNSAYGQESDNIFSVNISLPFSALLPKEHHSFIKNDYLSMGLTKNSQGDMDENMSLSGSLLHDNQLSYYLQQSYHRDSQSIHTDNYSLGASYQSAFANLTGNYVWSNTNSMLSYGASGAIVLHRHGVTLSQPLQETNALVYAKNAANLPLGNNQTIETDARGYAVLPGLMPYRWNSIGLDVDALSTSSGVALKQTNQEVVPVRGAIVLVNFKTDQGEQAVLTLTYQGKPVPFGAIVSTLQGEDKGIVSDNGNTYLTGLALKGQLKVKWGARSDQQCTVTYHFNDHVNTVKGIQFAHESCL